MYVYILNTHTFDALLFDSVSKQPIRQRVTAKRHPMRHPDETRTKIAVPLGNDVFDIQNTVIF